MNIPMLYVNPVTGPYAGRRWLCYVCQFGSAPVVAVFVKREAILNTRVIEAAQKLSDKHPELHAFIVCLSGPDPVLEANIRKLAEQEKYTVPMTVLPTESAVDVIYEVLPIRRESEVTALIYRGRQLPDEYVFRDMRFENSFLGMVPVTLSGGPGATGPAERPAVEDSDDFRRMDSAAAALIKG